MRAITYQEEVIRAIMREHNGFFELNEPVQGEHSFESFDIIEMDEYGNIFATDVAETYKAPLDEWEKELLDKVYEEMAVQEF